MADIKKYLDTTALGTLVDQIKSEDAKALDAAKKYADGLATNYDEAGAAATAESNAKKYTDELANGQVKTNKEAIATLNGDVNTVGSVAKAVADAKALIDADVDAVEGKADKNAQDIAAINNAETGILVTAKGYTDTEVAKVQGEVDALEGVVEDLEAYVGDIPEGYTQETVIAYINKKAEETLNAATGEGGESAASVKAALETYKTENNAAVAAVDAKAVKNAEDIAAETERATGVENGLASRIKAVEDDYLKAADKEELQGNIDTVAGAVERLTNGVSADEVDGVNDLIQYVKDHGPEVTGMKGDISKNATDIAAEAQRAAGAEATLTTAVEAAQTAADNAQAAADSEAERAKGVEGGLNTRLAAVEAKFEEGEGSVADQIADAKAETLTEAAADAAAKDEVVLKGAKDYTDAEIDKVEATVATLTETVGTKAAQADLNALAGRVTTAEGEIDTLQTEMDAVEALASANKAAHEANAAAIALKAAQTDLDKAVERIAVNEGDIATLKEASATHAKASDLTAAVERIAKNEQDIAANVSAIGAFTAITSDEVNALFA